MRICLMSGILLIEGFAHYLQSLRIHIASGIWEPFEKLVRERDSLDFLQSLANMQRQVVLLEDLVLGIESGDHFYQPVLVRVVDAVDRGDVEVVVLLECHHFIDEHLFDGRAYARFSLMSTNLAHQYWPYTT